MKGKQLATLLGLVAVVGGAGLYLKHDNQNSWSESGGGGVGKKVLELSMNDVATVTVKTTGAELNLVKKDDEWTVGERANYPANYDQVFGLIRKIWDMKTVQTVKVGPSQFARMELVEPGKGDGAGTLVEFKDKDGKALGSLVLGKKHMKKAGEDDMMAQFGGGGGFAAGRYVMKAGDKNVSLVSETLDEVNPKPESWLKRDFFKLENITSIALAGTTDTQKWKIARENPTAEWKLDGAKAEEALDNAKVNPLASAFAFPSFSDVMAPDAKAEETGLDKPAVLTFETADKFTYTLKIGKVNGENYPLTVSIAAALPKERTPGKDEKPEDKTRLDEEFKTAQKKHEEKLGTEKKLESRTFLVAKATIDQMLKNRADLLAEKKPETPPATPPAAGATPAPATPGLVQPPKPSTPISVTTPPVTVTTPPVTATTPPVAAPPMKPAAPAEKPAAPAEKPAAPAEKPAAPAEKPAAPAEKPAAPAEKPAAPAEKPAAPAEKPAAPAEKPAAPAEEKPAESK